MADARLTSSWSQVSMLAAYIHNSGINAKSAVTPVQINPYEKQKRKQRPKSVSAFREAMRSVVF